MRFGKQNDTFESGAGPGEDLLEARDLVVALRSQCRIGEEENAARHADRRSERKGVERLDINGQTAERAPVAAGVFEERPALRYPDRPAIASIPLVEDDRRAFASLSDAGAVADEIAHAKGSACGVFAKLIARFIGQKGAVKIAREGIAGLDDRLELGIGERARGPLLEKRSEEHTSELQSLMRISYAVFCLKKKKKKKKIPENSRLIHY